MRHIKKGDEPKSFADWKKKNPRADWKDFTGKTDEYHDLRKHLIEEQASLCCYCEINVADKNHIEHLKPLSRFPGDMFDYFNLMISCKHKDSCGKSKKNKYIDGFVSPLDSNCSERFTFTFKGEIIPIDEEDLAAQETIDILNLNCKRLLTAEKISKEN